MKLLRITAEGLPLFKEKLDLSFYAQQRVAEEQKNILYPLFSNIYMNPATGFIGINASGKISTGTGKREPSFETILEGSAIMKVCGLELINSFSLNMAPPRPLIIL